MKHLNGCYKNWQNLEITKLVNKKKNEKHIGNEINSRQKQWLHDHGAESLKKFRCFGFFFNYYYHPFALNLTMAYFFFSNLEWLFLGIISK